MLNDPATELIEQASRMRADDVYAMQQKEKVLEYARQLVAENERLKADLHSALELASDFYTAVDLPLHDREEQLREMSERYDLPLERSCWPQDYT